MMNCDVTLAPWMLITYCWGDNGYHPPDDYIISEETGGSSKEAKEAKNMVRNMFK